MKKLLKFSFMLAISCMSMIFASCDKFGTPSYSGDHPDSIYVAEAVEATVNPIFVSVGDAIDFQARMIEESNDEEVFMSLSPNVIANVTSVVIKNNGIARIRDIVHEYMIHQDIYDNLYSKDSFTSAQTPNTVKEESKNATEERHRPLDSVSTDTTSGKH